jgi:hypothetical protein
MGTAGASRLSSMVGIGLRFSVMKFFSFATRH